MTHGCCQNHQSLAKLLSWEFDHVSSLLSFYSSCTILYWWVLNMLLFRKYVCRLWLYGILMHFLCMTSSCNLYRTWIGGVAICQVISCPYVKLCSSHSFCCLSTFCSWLSLSLVCSIAQWTIVELFDLAWNCETSFTIMKTLDTFNITLWSATWHFTQSAKN